MTNLVTADRPEERVSYVFEGKSQSLEQVVALRGANQSAELRTLHVNSVLPDPNRRAITIQNAYC